MKHFFSFIATKIFKRVLDRQQGNVETITILDMSMQERVNETFTLISSFYQDSYKDVHVGFYTTLLYNCSTVDAAGTVIDRTII